MLKEYFTSSIGKKQVVAVTGLLLVLFLIAHLCGNLLIFQGPEAINLYSRTLHSLGGLLWIARIGLLATFLLHITFTLMVVIENRKARPIAYQGSSSSKRSLATRLMPYTGTILLAYVILHLFDFTLASQTGSEAFVNGQNLGLYGLIVNEFSEPISVLWYLLAMGAVGFHLSHGVQSVAQSFGINHPFYTPLIKKISVSLGVIIGIAFATIPLYVWLVVSQ